MSDANVNAKPDARAIVSLLVLSAIVGLNTVDRNMFGLLLPQIKQDIAISDAALGFLIGPAFMIVYSVAGLPIAWLADRSNRRKQGLCVDCAAPITDPIETRCPDCSRRLAILE